MPDATDTEPPAALPQIGIPYPIIARALASGRIIPFLGAGASIVGRPAHTPWTETSAFPPTGSELAAHLALDAGVGEAYGADDLAKVAQFYEISAGDRDTLADKITTLLGRPGFAQGAIHKLLAAAPQPLLVITTNYDELIESAFDEAGKPFDLVVHSTDPKHKQRVLWRRHGQAGFENVAVNRLDIDLATTTVVYKMHGTVASKGFTPGQFVITEDDYVEFLGRMTRGNAIPAVFAERFLQAPFLFLGYGLRDWNFRVVLGQLRSESRNVRSWAIQRAPSPLEARLWQHRGVELYDAALDDFASDLRARGNFGAN